MTPEPDPEQLADTKSLGLATPAAQPAFAPRTASLIENTILAKDEQDTYEQSKHKQILGFRRWLVPAVFGLTLAWLIFVGYAIQREQGRHNLSDAVIIAMLGTATATVLGLLVIVLKSLFPIELEREGE